MLKKAIVGASARREWKLMKLDTIHEGRAFRIVVGLMVLVFLMVGVAGAETTYNTSTPKELIIFQDNTSTVIVSRIGADISITGFPIIGNSTRDILAVNYWNFLAGDQYNITITRISDKSMVFAGSGTLMGGHKQVIPIDWKPHDKSVYLLVAKGDTVVASNEISVSDSRVIASTPETLALIGFGVFSLLLVAKKKK